MASAQSLDDLYIQIHGNATQGFLYTTQNNNFISSVVSQKFVEEQPQILRLRLAKRPAKLRSG